MGEHQQEHKWWTWHSTGTMLTNNDTMNTLTLPQCWIQWMGKWANTCANANPSRHTHDRWVPCALKLIANYWFYSCSNGDMSANHAGQAHDTSTNGSMMDTCTNSSTTARQMPTQMPAWQQYRCLLKCPHDSKTDTCTNTSMMDTHMNTSMTARQTLTQMPAQQ